MRGTVLVTTYCLLLTHVCAGGGKGMGMAGKGEEMV